MSAGVRKCFTRTGKENEDYVYTTGMYVDIHVNVYVHITIRLHRHVNNCLLFYSQLKRLLGRY